MVHPIAYPGRTPHVHFAISPRDGGRLVTQMYIAGETSNERDPVLNAIRDQAARARVVVQLEPASQIEAGALSGTFDIVLGHCVVPMRWLARASAGSFFFKFLHLVGRVWLDRGLRSLVRTQAGRAIFGNSGPTVW
jgi:hypothetical protein